MKAIVEVWCSTDSDKATAAAENDISEPISCRTAFARAIASLPCEFVERVDRRWQ